MNTGPIKSEHSPDDRALLFFGAFICSSRVREKPSLVICRIRVLSHKKFEELHDNVLSNVAYIGKITIESLKMLPEPSRTFLASYPQKPGIHFSSAAFDQEAYARLPWLSDTLTDYDSP